MLLRRRVGTTNTFQDVTVSGVAQGYDPGEIVGDIAQGDQRVTMGNSEIAAAGWPGPPRRGDIIVIDGRNWTVQGSNPRTLGAQVLVHYAHVRGG
jgi:hypothetical protein